MSNPQAISVKCPVLNWYRRRLPPLEIVLEVTWCNYRRMPPYLEVTGIICEYYNKGKCENDNRDDDQCIYVNGFQKIQKFKEFSNEPSSSSSKKS